MQLAQGERPDPLVPMAHVAQMATEELLEQVEIRAPLDPLALLVQREKLDPLALRV